MILVYPLAPHGTREELRYSLRAAERNLPHTGALVVGPKAPAWASERLEHLRVRESEDKWRNLPAAILAASQYLRGEQFVLMNDDFFVVSPTGGATLAYRGPIGEAPGYGKKGAGSYAQGFRQTERILRRLGADWDLLDYELHQPMPVDADLMNDALARAIPMTRDRVLMYRTLYANLHRLGGVRRPDVKIRAERGIGDWGAGPFVSTNDWAFARGEVGSLLRETFSTPSRYERDV